VVLVAARIEEDDSLGGTDRALSDEIAVREKGSAAFRSGVDTFASPHLRGGRLDLLFGHRDARTA